MYTYGELGHDMGKPILASRILGPSVGRRQSLMQCFALLLLFLSALLLAKKKSTVSTVLDDAARTMGTEHSGDGSWRVIPR